MIDSRHYLVIISVTLSILTNNKIVNRIFVFPFLFYTILFLPS